jgi:hypothetical protein
MAKKQDNKVRVCVPECVIDSRRFAMGEVVGECDADGTLKPTVEGVTRGHLEARVRFRELVVGPLPAELAAAEAEAKKKAEEEKAAAEAEAKKKANGGK